MRNLISNLLELAGAVGLVVAVGFDQGPIAALYTGSLIAIVFGVALSGPLRRRPPR